ncbi:MAG: hypothetical protein QOJ30_4640 [Pseudonocardiales bacterium]|jgi:hypothetical protein|nr:hypothetical protein [Pseudonocardiales bacterium]
MSIDVEDDPRTEPPTRGDDRALLAGFLRWQRETLELKCSGLDAEQLARRSVEPSSMSLLGLLRHLAEVERSWFRRIMSGEDAPKIYCTVAEPDGDFDGAAPDPALVAGSLGELAGRVGREESARFTPGDAPAVLASTAGGSASPSAGTPASRSMLRTRPRWASTPTSPGCWRRGRTRPCRTSVPAGSPPSTASGW